MGLGQIGSTRRAIPGKSTVISRQVSGASAFYILEKLSPIFVFASVQHHTASFFFSSSVAMPSSRRQSNGRSPLVNPQRQITSFFSRNTSSSSQQKANPNLSPPSIVSEKKLSPGPVSDRKPSPSPSPSTPSPSNHKCNKPLLLIGTSSPSTPSRPTPSPSPSLDSLSYGQEVVGRRIKVYWPLDKTLYEGRVRSFDKHTGKHLVLYDDDEEESLELAKEKIVWVQETVKKFKRLRRGLNASKQMVIEDEGAENVDVGEEEGGGDDSHNDDSSDEDWGKNENADDAEDADEDVELEDEEDVTERPKGKRGKTFESTKRKPSVEEKPGPAKKSKIAVEFGKGSFNVSTPELKSNPDSKWPSVFSLFLLGEVLEGRVYVFSFLLSSFHRFIISFFLFWGVI